MQGVYNQYVDTCGKQFVLFHGCSYVCWCGFMNFARKQFALLHCQEPNPSSKKYHGDRGCPNKSIVLLPSLPTLFSCTFKVCRFLYYCL